MEAYVQQQTGYDIAKLFCVNRDCAVRYRVLYFEKWKLVADVNKKLENLKEQETWLQINTELSFRELRVTSNRNSQLLC
jgi:hypothetical protein